MNRRPRRFGAQRVWLGSKRKLQKWWTRAPWASLSLMIAFVFVTAYMLMVVFEPRGSPILSLVNYFYFFMMTVATVGYGDIVPVTYGGKLTATYIMVGSIGAAAGAFTNFVTAIDVYTRRRYKGQLQLDMKDHIVIFGNRGLETATLIRGLLADEQSKGHEVVLCSLNTLENPFPDVIDFVHGEMTSDDVLTRACVRDALKIIIHAETDYASICIALAVKEKNLTAPIIVKANDPGKEVDIERIDRARVTCIKPIDVQMIVREVHNRGVTQVLEKLLAPEGQDLRSVEVPMQHGSFTFGALAHVFREQYGAILIGLRPGGHITNADCTLNPPFNTVVDGGTILDYISKDPVAVDWKRMRDLKAG